MVQKLWHDYVMSVPASLNVPQEESSSFFLLSEAKILLLTRFPYFRQRYARH